MSVQNPEPLAPRYTIDAPALHSLHECRSAEEFGSRFAESTGLNVRHVADDVVTPAAPRAIFLVGSVPLGMATSGSDLDFIVLVDHKAELLDRANGGANTDQQLVFSNENDPLMAGMFVRLVSGILIDVQVAIAPAIRRVYSRLRSRGPDLGDSEIKTLGRLSSGWMLWQTEGYLARSAPVLTDPAFDVYCCTKHFVAALINWRKAARVLDLSDIRLAVHMGRSSVELAYLAYFASEGLCYLGSKWLAQIGHARGAAERVNRHPLLEQNVHLLFPAGAATSAEAACYLQAVSGFLASMRSLIERKTLFRIAFGACPQIRRV